MSTIIDFILDLFRTPSTAASFIINPEGTLRDVGLQNVSPAQLASVAASAAPAGLILGDGDPVGGLQRAVSDYHNFAAPLSPSFGHARVLAPDTSTELASRNNTNAEFLSPDQSAGSNAQSGAFNLGLGDITLGDKTSNTATEGSVVVAGDNDGDIVSGDGAALGDGNAMTNGDILAGAGSNVAVGLDNELEDDSQTAGGDLITDNDEPVINEVDMSTGSGGGAEGGGGLLGIGGGNAAAGDSGNAGSIVISDSSTNGESTEINGDFGSDNVEDNSVRTETSTEANTSVEDNSSSLETNMASNNDTELASGNDTGLASANDTELASGNDTALASGNEFETDADLDPGSDPVSNNQLAAF